MDSSFRCVMIWSKHHDGFSLFKSMVSDYNTVDHAPLKRDIHHGIQSSPGADDCAWATDRLMSWGICPEEFLND